MEFGHEHSEWDKNPWFTQQDDEHPQPFDMGLPPPPLSPPGNKIFKFGDVSKEGGWIGVCKRASFKKRSNLDELINFPTKAEESSSGSMIQILFKTQDLNIKTGTIRDRIQNSQLIHDPLCFQNPRIRSLTAKIHNPCAF